MYSTAKANACHDITVFEAHGIVQNRKNAYLKNIGLFQAHCVSAKSKNS